MNELLSHFCFYLPLYKMIGSKSFLDELFGPFVSPPDLEPGTVTIKTELPKLLKFAIERLD